MEFVQQQTQLCCSWAAVLTVRGSQDFGLRAFPHIQDEMCSYRQICRRFNERVDIVVLMRVVCLVRLILSRLWRTIPLPELWRNALRDVQILHRILQKQYKILWVLAIFKGALVTKHEKIQRRSLNSWVRIYTNVNVIQGCNFYYSDRKRAPVNYGRTKKTTCQRFLCPRNTSSHLSNMWTATVTQRWVRTVSPPVAFCPWSQTLCRSRCCRMMSRCPLAVLSNPLASARAY